MSSFIKREYIEIPLVLIGVAIAFCIIFNVLPKKSDVVVIDCRLSEISPDFTTEMRQACRQAQAQNIQKDIQKPK